MAEQKVLVTGATGKVGRELVPLLLDAGLEVKAGTRDPDRARSLLSSEVEIVELNYARTETYSHALTWADRVFLMPPPFSPDSDSVIGAFLDWAVAARVQHVVLLSGMTVGDWTDLALRKVEVHLERQDTAHTILRPNLYMQNFYPGFISRQLRAGGPVRLPAGQGRVSLVDVRDVAAVAAQVLTTDRYHGSALTLTGPAALSMQEAVGVLSSFLPGTVSYKPVSDEAYRTILEKEGWRDGEIQVILGLFGSIRAGGREPVLHEVESVLGRPPRTFQAFARELGEHWG